jgi:endonuclease/exonuclease/phosphatase family metal-dependent hydrolase
VEPPCPSGRSAALSEVEEPEPHPAGGRGSLVTALVLGVVAIGALVLPLPGLGQLLQAVAPYLLAAAGLIAAFGVVRAPGWGRLRNFIVAFTLLAVAVVVARGGSDGVDRAGNAWTLLIWNVEGATVADVEDSLANLQPDVVILTEADGLALGGSSQVTDPYQHRLLSTEDGAPPSFVVLSKFPLQETDRPADDPAWDFPRVAAMSLVTPAGPVRLIGAHPTNALAQGLGSYGHRRDAQLQALCDVVDDYAPDSLPVIVAGDLNVTERETGSRCLDDRLTDAFDVAGGGVGATWRPIPQLPPVLRIDRVLVEDESVAVVGLDTHCAAAQTDHCAVMAALQASE